MSIIKGKNQAPSRGESDSQQVELVLLSKSPNLGSLSLDSSKRRISTGRCGLKRRSDAFPQKPVQCGSRFHYIQEMHRTAATFAVLIGISACLPGSAGQDIIPGTPFHSYFTQDRLGRPIHFFLGGEASASHAVPLVVWVQGTGCSSVFGHTGDRITQGPQILLHDAVRGRARVLAVDKPGVVFLDKQADAADSTTCRPEFLKEHTLDRWAEAIVSAIRAAYKLPGVDQSRTLVIGASEGGIVALRVSNALPTVTHVASLAGGGPVHLFDLAEFCRRKGLDPEKEVFECWQGIMRDPDSTAKFCWGHPHRALSSFMKTSLVQEALRSRAELYFAHGTADGQNFIAGFDVLRAELAGKGRAAVFDRIQGADHGMNQPSQSPPEGLVKVLDRILVWFLPK